MNNSFSSGQAAILDVSSAHYVETTHEHKEAT